MTACIWQEGSAADANAIPRKCPHQLTARYNTYRWLRIDGREMPLLRKANSKMLPRCHRLTSAAAIQPLVTANPWLLEGNLICLLRVGESESSWQRPRVVFPDRRPSKQRCAKPANERAASKLSEAPETIYCGRRAWQQARAIETRKRRNGGAVGRRSPTEAPPPPLVVPRGAPVVTLFLYRDHGQQWATIIWIGGGAPTRLDMLLLHWGGGGVPTHRVLLIASQVAAVTSGADQDLQDSICERCGMARRMAKS